MADKTDIWVYADWKGMLSPKCIGILSAQQANGRKAFSAQEQTCTCIIGKKPSKSNDLKAF